MKAWYLLYCKPKSEVRAQQNLQIQEIETYLPLYKEQKKLRSGKTTEVKVPLFTNYLFIRFDPKVVPVSRIHSTRGVSQIVGCKEKMTPLDDELIESIRFNVTKQLNEAIPDEFFMKGDEVRFIDGPFKNIEGVFDEKSGEKRCFVLLKIMGQMKRVHVVDEFVEKISA
ncbi:transcription/translation regulatory transformer protein RfaH [Parashewanella spongiae]|uniref:Transcription antitermination protein RfaH n=1 Tax=Parashewanella spongiae TaxID=342950 RepID=A0A3A6TZ40_9GAMM|nr:transcription/translation regulatory transformer protein RfaH [Parashewanella spongiae]MCL1077675.1 transcription/translation regulatory transformer protein RfaH [Parashewanella spongiae]RJY18239.1 transcription/translation regulatory transformer protein RfaH [Parashewanella spongiae]